MSRMRYIIIGAVALLLLVFVIQNSEVVSVTLLFWDFQMSRIILVLLTTLTGFVTGYIVARLTKPHGTRQGEPLGRR